MTARRRGGRRPLDDGPTLRERWLDVVASAGARVQAAIGGKSMGGRIASLVADEVMPAQVTPLKAEELLGP